MKVAVMLQKNKSWMTLNLPGHLSGLLKVCQPVTSRELLLSPYKLPNSWVQQKARSSTFDVWEASHLTVNMLSLMQQFFKSLSWSAASKTWKYGTEKVKYLVKIQIDKPFLFSSNHSVETDELRNLNIYWYKAVTCTVLDGGVDANGTHIPIIGIVVEENDRSAYQNWLIRYWDKLLKER